MFFLSLCPFLCGQGDPRSGGAVFPVLAGGLLVVLAELPVEVGQVVKSSLLGNFKDGQVGVVEQVAGLLEPKLNQVLHTGQAQTFLKKVHKMRRAITAHLGQFQDGNGLGVVFADVVDDQPNLVFLAVVVLAERFREG